MAAPFEREFAGEVRVFELLPGDRSKMYRGVETYEYGTITEMTTRAARNALGSNVAAHVLSHAMSGGHAITLIHMRKLVLAEMRKRPLNEFMSLVVEILANAYVGDE